LANSPQKHQYVGSYSKEKGGCLVLALLVLAIVLALGYMMNAADTSAKDVKTEHDKYLNTLQPTPIAESSAPKYRPNPTLAASLKSHFDVKKDKYEGSFEYQHKTAPKFVNRNGIYCQFYTSGPNATPDIVNFYFNIQY
jgi:hypothetical protein